MIKYCEEGCDISSDISDTEFTAIGECQIVWIGV